MKYLAFLAGFFLQSFIFAQQPVETYPVDSASIERAGVPKGEVFKFVFDHSAIYPGTTREVSVYVPVQYKAATPACVYVNQDGVQWKAPVVFDNLIFKNEMPVTIGVFVTPGKVLADSGTLAQDRYNRSFEYDGLGDAYAKFILNEILPEVEKRKQATGVQYDYRKMGMIVLSVARAVVLSAHLR